jgi:hypothetical protein
MGLAFAGFNLLHCISITVAINCRNNFPRGASNGAPQVPYLFGDGYKWMVVK